MTDEHSDAWSSPTGHGVHGEAHRTCDVCGGDCPPEPCGADGLGARLVFVCPRHGVQSIVDSFSRLR